MILNKLHSFWFQRQPCLCNLEASFKETVGGLPLVEQCKRNTNGVECYKKYLVQIFFENWQHNQMPWGSSMLDLSMR